MFRPRLRGPRSSPYAALAALLAALLIVIARYGAMYFFCDTSRMPERLTLQPRIEQPSRVRELGIALPSSASRIFPGRPDTAWLSTALSEMLTSELARRREAAHHFRRECGAGKERSRLAGNRQSGCRHPLPRPQKSGQRLRRFWVLISTWATALTFASIFGCRMRTTGQIVSTVTRRGSENASGRTDHASRC